MKTVYCFCLDQFTYSFVFMNPKGLRIIPSDGQKMKIRLEKTKIDILLNFLVFFPFLMPSEVGEAFFDALFKTPHTNIGAQGQLYYYHSRVWLREVGHYLASP